MSTNLIREDDGFRTVSPETLSIVAVHINPHIQGSLACTLSAGGVESGIPVQSSEEWAKIFDLYSIRQGMFLTVDCVHMQMWNKSTVPTQNIAFHDILQQVISADHGASITGCFVTANDQDLTPANDTEITLQIELNHLTHAFEYIFRLKPVDPGPAIHISMTRVNQAIPGHGFHYIGLLADGSPMFERRLTRAPYPQEISLDPMFSFTPEEDLRLCLYRRPFYIWPIKSLVKSSAVTASEVHPLLQAGPPEGIGDFAGTPEITVRMHMQNSKAVLDQSAKVVSDRDRLLERLGRSRELLENVAQLFSAASEMHPIAKTLTVGLGQLYTKLAELEDWDDKLLELIDKMTRFLAHVDNIKSLATIEALQTTLKRLEPMIQRAGNLILKYSRHGLSFQKEMAEYNSLKRSFEEWTDQFSHGVAVENLNQIAQVQEMIKEQKEFFTKQFNDVLNRIRPPGMDRNRPISGCLEGTRKRIFEKIDTFVAEHGSPNILWIKGSPGSGKSSVARSVVQKLANTSHLGASFFFERDNTSFTAPSTMLRSLSVDLCTRPAFWDALVATQSHRIDFNTSSISHQFQRLVEEPLKSVVNELQERDNLVLVLDALDECGGLAPSHSRDLQQVLATVKRLSAISPFLRLVVTSGADETSISEVLNPISTPLKLKLSSRHAAQDIELFLNLELKKIGAKHGLVQWPTQEQIHTLAVKARGLFVWATTLVKFMDQFGPRDMLRLILEGDHHFDGDLAYLYNLILKISLYPDHQPTPKFLRQFHTFVGAIVTVKHPLTNGSPLFEILGVEASTAKYICEQLRSVMVPDQDVVRFDHESFVDFLTSKVHPRSFRISRSTTKRTISVAILKLLNTNLRFDPSKFRTSHCSNPKTQHHISGQLLYACQYWSDTLPVLEDRPGDLHILVSLKTFLETKFLFWLEALSLTGQMSCARVQLLGAKESVGALDMQLCVFVADAITFVDEFQECITKSAPHVYLSAMAFVPESSKIHQTYWPLLHRPCASLTIQTASDLRNGRSTMLASIVYFSADDEDGESFEGHVDEILSTVFIENGYVASASYDGTIRFWDPDSGKPVLKPFGLIPAATNLEPIKSLAFSKETRFMVSGSRSGDVAIWNMKCHRKRVTFAHKNPVTCVALSPKGTVVMVGCKNGTVAFWDIQSRQECRTAFRAHAERVTAVIFLEDDIALSGSVDKSIYIHHIFGNSEILVRVERAVYSLAATIEPRGFVAACYGHIAVWSLSDENVPSHPVILAKNSCQVESVAVHGTRVAAAVGLKVEIWDFLTGKLVLGPLRGHWKQVVSVAFSEDGQRLVSGSRDHSIRVWNVGSGDAMSFGGFPDGSEIASSGWIRGPKPKEDLIIWVPKAYRRRLCWGRAVAVMDGRPAAYLTVDETILGRRWYKTYLNE
ncbi:hypothetical protein K438DRAFT_2018987 [Mycena galopus ATCC 62051]|nr:hypothetical protein K438DRAFT_2018987 [Mycena galopus ATCC 62051]